MRVLLDTNILLRISQPDHPQALSAEDAVDRLMREGEDVVIAVQNTVEFWTVATRPIEQNGLGFTIEQATIEVNSMRKSFPVLPELPLHSTWEHLVKTYRISGKTAMTLDWWPR